MELKAWRLKALVCSEPFLFQILFLEFSLPKENTCIWKTVLAESILLGKNSIFHIADMETLYSIASF